MEAPYLQLVLERLWEVERERGSERAARRDAGRARRRRADRRGAPRARAAGLDAGERDLVARLFNHLVTPSGTKIAHAVDDLARYAARGSGAAGAGARARWTRRVFSAASRADAAGRRGTRSSTTCSHRPCSPGARGTRPNGRWSGSGRRRRRRHRRVAVVAAVALVALAGTMALAVWALSQRAEAREQATRRGCRRAGCEGARARGERDRCTLRHAIPSSGLLLATHAARLAPAASTEDVLRRTLARVPRANGRASLGSRRSAISPLCPVARSPPSSSTAACGSSRGERPAASSAEPRPSARKRWLSRASRRSPCVADDDRPLPASRERGRDRPGSVRTRASRRRGPRPADSSLRASAGQASSARDGELLAPLPHPARVHRAAFSPNGHC